MKTALAPIGALGCAATLALFAAAASAQQTEAADPQAEVAVDAYEKADAGPVENWFGCPPVAKGDEPARKAADDCDPTQTRRSPTQSTDAPAETAAGE